MTRSRLLTVLVTCALIASASPALTTVAAAQSAVQISSVSVTPNETVTGESVSVETTIANLERTNGTVEITDVYLRTSGSTEGHGRIEDVGSISPGGSVTVPMSVTFDSAGEKRLTAHVVVRDESGDHHSYEYPVYVDVEEPSVKAELSTSTTANSSDAVDVSLTNFGNTDLTDVEVTATAGGETVGSKYLFDVDPGASQSTTFDTSGISADNVTFTANYAAAGDAHETTHTADLDSLEEVPGEIRLTGVEATRTGTGLSIDGDAANVGGTDTKSVSVAIPDAEGVSPVPPSGEYFIGAIDASEFATFDLTGEIDSDVESVPVEITYIVDGDRVTATQEVPVESGGSPGVGGTGQPGGSVGDQNQADGPSGPGGSNAQAGPGGLPLVPIGVALVALVLAGVLVYRWKR